MLNARCLPPLHLAPPQVSSDAELLHVSNELIRRDVAHEIKDIGGFNIGRLSQDSKNLFRLIDDEPPSYLKKRNTLVSFISPRYPQSAAGFSVLPSSRIAVIPGGACAGEMKHVACPGHYLTPK